MMKCLWMVEGRECQVMDSFITCSPRRRVQAMMIMRSTWSWSRVDAENMEKSSCRCGSERGGVFWMGHIRGPRKGCELNLAP